MSANEQWKAIGEGIIAVIQMLWNIFKNFFLELSNPLFDVLSLPKTIVAIVIGIFALPKIISKIIDRFS